MYETCALNFIAKVFEVVNLSTYSNITFNQVNVHVRLT